MSEQKVIYLLSSSGTSAAWLYKDDLYNQLCVCFELRTILKNPSQEYDSSYNNLVKMFTGYEQYFEGLLKQFCLEYSFRYERNPLLLFDLDSKTKHDLMVKQVHSFLSESINDRLGIESFPPWATCPDMRRSHINALLKKNPKHYSPYFDTFGNNFNNTEIFWPL
jgi:hypothetical protein